MGKSALQEGFDFNLFSNQGLDLISYPKYGTLAKKLLENRGYRVTIKDGKARFEEKVLIEQIVTRI